MAEQAALNRWENRTEWPLAAVALVFLAAFSFRVLGRPHGVSAHLIDTVSITSWLVFAVDYAARLWLAPNRWAWFLRHLPGLAIVALPLLQPLRGVRLVILLEALQKALGSAIHGRLAIYTVTGATLLVYTTSLAELQVERDQPGATITNFGTAVWWAITTITTVGYGTEYPVTTPGRVIAAGLMISGMTLVGMITATAAAYITRHLGVGTAAAPGPAPADEVAALRAEIAALRAALPGPDAPAP